MIKVGDRLPAGTLQEYIEVEGGGCSIGPNSFDIGKSCAGKRIAVFGLPGAYTPTCSAQHVPSYVARADELEAAGVDEIWCVSVDDGIVKTLNIEAPGKFEVSDADTMLAQARRLAAG